MGVWYDYYLEYKFKDQWYCGSMFRNKEGVYQPIPLFGGKSIGRYIYDEFGMGSVNWENLSEDLKNYYTAKIDDYWERPFYLMDYSKMMDVYKNNIYDYSGFVPINDIKKFEAGIIDYMESLTWEEYSHLDDKTKRYYGYYEWDDWDSCYYYAKPLAALIDGLIRQIKDKFDYDDDNLEFRVICTYD